MEMRIYFTKSHGSFSWNKIGPPPGELSKGVQSSTVGKGLKTPQERERLRKLYIRARAAVSTGFNHKDSKKKSKKRKRGGEYSPVEKTHEIQRAQARRTDFCGTNHRGWRSPEELRKGKKTDQRGGQGDKRMRTGRTIEPAIRGENKTKKSQSNTEKKKQKRRPLS